MLGICIEAGMTCPSCEGYIPLNALVESIRCPACGTVHQLGLTTWKTLLDDAIAEVPFSEEGEGSSSTIFGNYNYRLQYGRLHPRYSGTRDDIPEDEILGALETGSAVGKDPAVPTSVRPMPEFCREEFPGIVALIGEDTSLLPGGTAGEELTLDEGSGPVAFQCPSCGGSLLVDGSDRKETCRFCDTVVTMPDELWQIFHPARTVERWFLLLDPLKAPVKWESEVFGAVPCPDGDIFMALENDHSDYPVLTRVHPDGSPAWTRYDLDVDPGDGSSSPGPVVAPDGSILLMSGNSMDLVVLAPDGSDLNVIEGSSGDAEPGSEGLPAFTMKGCTDITCMPDGSLLLFTDRGRRDGSGTYFHELMRFGKDGEPMPVWPEVAKEGDGLKSNTLSFLVRLFRRMRRVVEPNCTRYLKDIPDRPVKFMDTDILLASGADGSLYLLRDTWLAAFDRTGRKKYCVELPCHLAWGRPVPTPSGEVFILVETEDDRYQVLRVPGNGVGIEVHADSIKDGGPVDDADLLVLSSDGVLNVIGYGGSWSRIPGP